MSTKNPFDFADLSDLPEDLAKKLATEGADHAKVYAEVVRKGAEAGFVELDINQIIAASIRMGIDVPTQQTVRGYLNKAVELGLVSKPSRQTYGIGAVQATPEAGNTLGAQATAASAKGKAKAEEVVTADPTVASDPLAGLGI